MAQQDVKFNIVANTQGMEAIAALINRVGALEAETNKLRTANAGLAASTDAVVRNGTRYNNALDAQSKAVRNARQGAQQLGMQFNDLATSISTGAKPSQAFNQQLGQMGFALSMMEGRLGAVGRFLAGPWGAAITLAVMAIAPLIDKLWETVFAADEAGKKLQDAAKKFNDSLVRSSALTDVMTEATNQRAEAMAKLGRAQQRLASMQKIGNAAFIGDPASAEARFRVMADLRAEIKKQKALISQSDQQVREAVASQRSVQTQADRISARYPKPETAKSKREEKPNFGMSFSEAFKEFSEIINLREKARSSFDSLVEGVTKRGVPAWKQSINDLNAAYQELRDNNEATALDLENLNNAVSKLAAEGVNESKNQILNANSEIRKSYEAIGMSVNDAFKGMLTAGMSWKDGMRGVIQSVIDELWRLFVVQQIVGIVKNAIGGAVGGFDGIDSGKISNKLMGKAIGGSVSSNTPYLVGERGPELFVPGGNGTIIPNKNMGGGSSGNTISVNVDARGSSDPAAVRAQVQKGILEAAPAIIAAAEQRTINSIRRPRLGGAMQ